MDLRSIARRIQALGAKVSKPSSRRVRTIEFVCVKPGPNGLIPVKRMIRDLTPTSAWREVPLDSTEEGSACRIHPATLSGALPGGSPSENAVAAAGDCRHPGDNAIRGTPDPKVRKTILVY
jgi:hypothetical protein